MLLRNVLLATGETERVNQLPDEDDHTRAKYEALFQSTFANAPREPELAVNATLKAARFLRNNESLLWLLQRRQGNLVDRLANLKKPAAIAEAAFLQILSRPATSDEQAMVKSFLENQADRDQALGDLAWALMTSAEFCKPLMNALPPSIRSVPPAMARADEWCRGRRSDEWLSFAHRR